LMMVMMMLMFLSAPWVVQGHSVVQGYSERILGGVARIRS
jgi:hypothetical protein